MGIGELQEIRAQLDARKVRLLAVASDSRIPSFPDVRTVKEQGIDLAVRKFRGLAGPRNTPREAIVALEAAIPRLLADPKYKQIYTANGLQPGFLPHAEYVTFLNEFARQAEGFLRQEPLVALYVATVLARRLDEVNRHLIQAWGRSAEPEQRRWFFTETLRKMAGALQIGVPRSGQAG